MIRVYVPIDPSKAQGYLTYEGPIAPVPAGWRPALRRESMWWQLTHPRWNIVQGLLIAIIAAALASAR